MKVKDSYSVIDIIGIVLIFIVLVILVIPFILKIVNNYKYDGSIVKIQALYNSVLEEYKDDTNYGRNITVYCYRDDYGYEKTLNNGTVKSITNLKDDISYYVTFDSKGNIQSFTYADKIGGINLTNDVTEVTINSLTDSDFITRVEAFDIISKCPYNSN